VRANNVVWLTMAWLSTLLFVWTPAVGLTLHESIEIALERNEEIRALVQKERAAGYGLMESVGNFLPSVSLSSTYSRAEGGRTFDFPIATRADLTTGKILYEASVKTSFLEKRAHDTKVEVVQPVFQGGALWGQLGMARAQRSAVRHELQAKRNEIALKVQEAYYGILEAEKMLQAMDEAVQLSREHVRVAQALYDAGMVSRAETLRADVLLSSTLQDRVRAKNALSMARRSFNSLLARDLDELIHVEEPGEFGPVGLSLPECIRQATEKNPGLISFRKQVEAAGKTIQLSRSGFLPKLNLVFDYGWHEEAYHFDPNNDFWTVMGVASWDIFTSGRHLAEYQQSKAGQRQLEHELEAYQDAMVLQVTQAYLELEEARQGLELAEGALASAEENYRVTAASYGEGISSQVDEIDAQVTLTEVRVNYSKTRYQMYVAKAKLENLMGEFIEPD
jgi:outer membrane protein